ncbi:LytR/AlgR family response regulator transcription factor [Tenacibaculum sp. nBUS_03]|uniref:LytR/AlgR family response regulator transcription factor n=1 Tax=Tenacibaculum sp. nBUS_03 TaxID=3395320 RepID=UPI003EBF0430
MLKCIIVDDEQPARKLLESYCKKIKDVKVIGTYKSGLDTLTILKEEQIDILFLDIQMPDISGIDFLKSLKLYHTKVVFTTAYRDYAFEGFELGTLDYLLKPIEFHRFVKTIEKIKDVQQKPQKLEIKDKGIEESLIIRSDKKQYRIQTSEILFVKSENEYVKYVTKNHGNLMVYGSLKKVINSFTNSEKLIRIHRSYIVNLAHISYVEGNRVCINGKHHIPVSETYRLSFFKTWK